MLLLALVKFKKNIYTSGQSKSGQLWHDGGGWMEKKGGREGGKSERYQFMI